jgi:hypothetical protein
MKKKKKEREREREKMAKKDSFLHEEERSIFFSLF